MDIKSFICEFSSEQNKVHITIPCYKVVASGVCAQGQLNFIEKAIINLVDLGFDNPIVIAPILCLDLDLVTLVWSRLSKAKYLDKAAVSDIARNALNETQAQTCVFIKDAILGQLLPVVFTEFGSNLINEGEGKYSVGEVGKDLSFKFYLHIKTVNVDPNSPVSVDLAMDIIRRQIRSKSIASGGNFKLFDSASISKLVFNQCSSDSLFNLHCICQLDSRSEHVTVSFLGDNSKKSTELAQALLQLPDYDYIKYKLLYNRHLFISQLITKPESELKQSDFAIDSCSPDLEPSLIQIKLKYDEIMADLEKTGDMVNDVNLSNAQSCLVAIFHTFEQLLIQTIAESKLEISNYNLAYFDVVKYKLNLSLVPDIPVLLNLLNCAYEELPASGLNKLKQLSYSQFLWHFQVFSNNESSCKDYSGLTTDVMQESVDRPESGVEDTLDLNADDFTQVLRATFKIVSGFNEALNKVSKDNLQNILSQRYLKKVFYPSILLNLLDALNNQGCFDVVLRKYPYCVGNLLALKKLRDGMSHGDYQKVPISINTINSIKGVLQGVLSVWNEHLAKIIDINPDEIPDVYKGLQKDIEVKLVLTHYFDHDFLRYLGAELNYELYSAEASLQAHKVLDLDELNEPSYLKQKTARDNAKANKYKIASNINQQDKDQEIPEQAVLKLASFIQKLFFTIITKQSYDAQAYTSNFNERLKWLSDKLERAGFDLNINSKKINFFDKKWLSQPHYISNALLGETNSTLGGCFVAFLLLSREDYLAKIAKEWPNMIKDIKLLIYLRGHGLHNRTISLSQTLRLKKRIYTKLPTVFRDDFVPHHR